MTCMRWPAAAGWCTGRRLLPPRVPPGHCLRISLQAWCVYLMAAHAIPVHRCAELIEALTGAELAGFVHGMLARAAAAARHANVLIRALIITGRDLRG